MPENKKSSDLENKNAKKTEKKENKSTLKETKKQAKEVKSKSLKEEVNKQELEKIQREKEEIALSKKMAKEELELQKAREKYLKSIEDAIMLEDGKLLFDYPSNSHLTLNELKKVIAKAVKKKYLVKQSDINEILDGLDEDKDVVKFLKWFDKLNAEVYEDEDKSDAYNIQFGQSVGDGYSYNPVSQYLKESHNPKFSKEEELELFRRISQGDEQALDIIYNANRLLVFKCARDIYRNNKNLPLENLIAAGNFGLIKAIEKFDWQKDNKLSTYATYWINQSIRRTLSDKGRLVRIPVHMGDKISKMKKANRLLTQELGRSPSDDEIAERMNKDEKEKAKKNGKKYKGDIYTGEKIKDLRSYSHQIQSLDKKVNNGTDDDESSQIDFVEATGELTPVEYDNQQKCKDTVNEMLSTLLSDKEEQIIRYRWGLFDDEKKYTLDEVGALMNLTRERIRQIEGKAIKKLKQNTKLLKQLIK